MRCQSLMLELGRPAADFQLPDTTGRSVQFRDVAGPAGTFVVFICNHCPFVQYFVEDLVTFANDYAAKGIGSAAISSNDVAAQPDDGPEQMAQFAAQHQFSFPYLYDATQAVAKAYGAACTPDLFLYDAEARLYYRGQFDGGRPKTPHSRPIKAPIRGGDLRGAAERLLAGLSPPESQVPSIGCSMKWAPGNEPEWA